MAADKTYQSQKDLNRIDVNDPVQVQYVHYQFPWLSYEEIKEAIRKHGPDREAVQAYLERLGRSKDNDQ